jgi:hypothetical protein
MAARGKTATLSIVIAGDNKGAKKAIAGTEKDMTGLAGRAKSLAAGIGAAYAVTKVVQWGKAASDTYRTVGGEVIKLQRFTGLAAEEASGLRLAAQMSGIDVAKLATSLGQLNKRIESGSIDDLGFQFRDAHDEILPMDQVLGQIMDRFAEMPNGTEKTALAMQLFGRAGADMIPLLSRGSAALEEFKQQAADLGLSFDEQGLEDVKEATRNQRELNAALQGMKVAVGAELTPLINDVTNLGKTALPPTIAGLRTVLGLFTALPAPVQTSVVAFGAAALVLPRLATAINAVSASNAGLTGSYMALRSAMANNVSNLKASTVALSAAAAAIVSYGLTTAALNNAADQSAISADAQDLTTALTALGRTGEVSGELEKYGASLEGIAEAMRNVNKDKGDALADVAFDWGGLTDAAGAKKTLDEFDAVLKSMAETNPEAATRAFGEIVLALREQGFTTEEVARAFPAYFEGMDNAAMAADNEAAATDRATAATRRQVDTIRSAREALEWRAQRAQAIISATDGVRSAESAAADAASDLAEAQREASASGEAITAAREAEADALAGVSDALEAVEDAEKGVADAVKAEREAQEGVRDALAEVGERREDLNEAYAEAREKVDDLARASRQAALDEKEAVLNVREAQEELARVLSDSTSTDLERDQAQLAVEQAQADAADAAAEAQQAQQDAANARNLENDEGVISAKQALAESIRGVAEAEDRQREAAEGVREAQERVAEAQQGVVAAEGRVQDARRNTAKVTAEARKRVEEAEEASRDATLNLIRAQSDLETAVRGTEAGLKAQRDMLIELAESFAPGTKYREYLETLIELLGGALEAGNIPQDESRDPYRGPITPPPGHPGGGSPDANDRARRGAVTLHVYGSSIQERRAARAMLEDFDRQRAQAVTGG